MLVLSRKRAQSIRIGSGIAITVVKIEGRQVRIGISAPPDMAILRDELGAHSVPRVGARPTARPRRGLNRRVRPLSV